MPIGDTGRLERTLGRALFHKNRATQVPRYKVLPPRGEGADVAYLDTDDKLYYWNITTSSWIVLAIGAAAHTEDHDHDGTPTQKLLAANTHETPSANTHHAESHAVPSHSGTPGGELGGTWTTPTVDATHSGSAHHAQSHTLASHSTKPHSALSDAPADAHHTEVHAPESHSGTDITGVELEDLSDGGATTLHTHAGGGVTKVTKIIAWSAESESQIAGDTLDEFPNGICVGEAGERGTLTAIRAKATASVVGVGTNEIDIEVDNAPSFPSPTVIATIPLNTALEANDVTFAAWSNTDIFVRARWKSVGGTQPTRVRAMLIYEELLQ